MPQVRQGNVYIESISYSLANGATPSTLQITLSRQANIVVDTPIMCFVGGSQWQGRVTDVRDIRNESVGLITQIRGVDFRDNLAGQVIFGQFNMIDKDDGSIYQINDFNYVGNWINQIVEVYHIAPRTLIDTILDICGFSAVYSSGVSSILYEAGLSWTASMFNLYNLDWNTGIKAHAALNEICNRLGIQFTILMDSPILMIGGVPYAADPIVRFTVVGEADYPGLAWEGLFATDSEVGIGVNAEVDTGVFITGDRQLNEFVDLPTEPAWEQAWNPYFWDTLLLADKVDEAGLDLLTSTVREFAIAYGIEYLDLNFIEAEKFFADFTIKDYIRTVPYHIYRMPIIQQYLTDDEFRGVKRVRVNPIVTPLVSDPGVQYTVKASSVNMRTKKIKNPLQISSTKTEQQAGTRLIESSGHIVFDRARFKISEDAIGKTYLDPSDLEPDEPVVRCVILGPVYSQFFGLDIRIGTKHVPNLRVAKVVEDPALSPDDYPEFIFGTEKSADQTALDIATAYLWRDRVTSSGRETFRGFAGHIPTGEINRVTVTMNKEGITEEVTYSNDEPSPEYDPHIEQRRRIEQENLKRAQEEIRTTKQRDALHEQRLEAGGKIRSRSTDFPTDHLAQAAIGALKDGYGVINNTDGASYVAGQPIVGAPDATSKQLASTAQASIQDGEKQILGLTLYKTNSTKQIPALVHGIGQGLVIGPVVKGDALVYDSTKKCLKKGTGGTCIAMETYATATVKAIAVRVGSSAGGGAGNVTVVAASTANVTLSGNQTLDTFLCTNGFIVLVHKQTIASQNGLYTVNSGGAWTRYGDLTPGMLIDVTNGSEYLGALFFLFTTGTITIGTTAVQFLRVFGTDLVSVKAISAAALAPPLTGTQTIDTISCTTGDLVLLKQQAIATSNGVYRVNSAGLWTFLGQPKCVVAEQGSANNRCRWHRTSIDTYQGGLDYWG